MEIKNFISLNKNMINIKFTKSFKPHFSQYSKLQLFIGIKHIASIIVISMTEYLVTLKIGNGDFDILNHQKRWLNFTKKF